MFYRLRAPTSLSHLGMVRVPMGRSLPACLLVLLMLGFGCSALEHVKFLELDPAAPNQVVLMMEHADDSGEEILNAVLETEEFIHDIGGGNITFKMCDASNPVNAKAMAEKGLQDFPLLFVSIAGQGMGAPPGPCHIAMCGAGIITTPPSLRFECMCLGRSLRPGDHDRKAIRVLSHHVGAHIRRRRLPIQVLPSPMAHCAPVDRTIDFRV